MSETRSGGCLCGAVRYTAKLKDDTFSACHCGMCRRWTGGPLMSTAVEVSWESEDDLRVYTSSDWAERGFCVKCGSSLTYRITAQGPHHGVTVITVGSLDDSSGLEFGLEWFIDRKPEGYAFEGDRKRLTEAEVM